MGKELEGGKGSGGRERWEGTWRKGTGGRKLEEGNCGKGTRGKGIGARELEEGNCPNSFPQFPASGSLHSLQLFAVKFGRPHI